MNIKKQFLITLGLLFLLVGGIALSSTITEISGTDTISASRTTINTNFVNLNADKIENTSTFTVSTSTNKVGIATTTPAYTLDVYGNARLGTSTASSIYLRGTVNIGGMTNGFLKIDASGNVSTSTIDISDNTNLVAGNYLTLSGDTVNLDTVMASGTISINLLNATNTKEAMFKKQNALTLVKVSCNSQNGTTTFNLQERTEASPNSGGTTLLSASLVCGVSGTASSSAFADSAIAANVPVVASTTAVVGTSVNTYIYVDYFVND